MADISKRLEKAEKYLQRSKPEAALEEYLDILDEEPKNDQVRQAAADLCLALDRRPQAAELLSFPAGKGVRIRREREGSITYKKLCKITTPTPMQTFQYAQLTEKRDRKEALDAYLPRPCRDLNASIKKSRRWPRANAWWNFRRPSKTCSSRRKKLPRWVKARPPPSNFVQLGLLQDQEVARVRLCSRTNGPTILIQ